MEELIHRYELDLAATKCEVESAEIKVKLKRAVKTQKAEAMQEPFRIVNSSVKPRNSGAVTKLWVPHTAKDPKVAARFCEPYESLTAEGLIKMAQSDYHSVNYTVEMDSGKIEKLLLSYNSDWFRAAAISRFGHGEWYDIVGYDGLTQEADSILNGDYVEHCGMPMTPVLKEFLIQCQRSDTTTNIDSKISPADYVSGFSKWSENTATSPSGRTLNHYKTIITDDELCFFVVAMINLPIQYGFTLERWKTSVMPHLEKVPGKPYLTRFRVIHLFELLSETDIRQTSCPSCRST
jgi:hypothetical protein